MHTHVHAYIHTNIHTYVHTYIHTCITINHFITYMHNFRVLLRFISRLRAEPCFNIFVRHPVRAYLPYTCVPKTAFRAAAKFVFGGGEGLRKSIQPFLEKGSRFVAVAA